jgi:UDP-glucose 4-epimerase
MITPPVQAEEERFSRTFAGRNVLITGGLGFIGSNLAHKLVALGAKVTLFDALIEQCGGSRENIRGIEERVRLAIADMCDRKLLEYHVRGKDFIFHLAGQVSHMDSMRNPHLDLDVNALATLNLVEACRRCNPLTRVIFTSTRQVYGRARHLPVNERHATCPVDINGIHKLAAERYLILYHKVHGLWATVLRLTNTYGPRQRIGDERQGVAALFIHRALAGEPLVLFGGGQQRDFNYVDDVVRALLLAASREECGGKIFNLGGTRPHTLAEFAATLHALCNCPMETVPFPSARKSIEIGDYVGDFSRFYKRTGWRPLIDLDQGLARTIAFWRNRWTDGPDPLAPIGQSVVKGADDFADESLAPADVFVQES